MKDAGANLRKALKGYIEDLNQRLSWGRVTLWVEVDKRFYRAVVEPYSVPVDDDSIEQHLK